jgi:hypothetical protein
MRQRMTMLHTRRFNASLACCLAVFLAGCQAGSDSTTGEGKRSGGLLGFLRREPITLPEGMTFPLVLETAISSVTSRSGDSIVARLAEDVRIGEKVVVPAGSEVRGRVTEAVPSGRVKTRARLGFEFDTLVLEGKEYPIGTRPVGITARSTHKKDAATIGIGAGAGALIGAIANGGKGAGIGALIGGAAGTGVVLADTGKEVVMGSGTRVTVRLIREARL